MADNIDFALNDHFYDFVDDWNYKFYFLVGGYGSSKSYHVAVKLIKKLLESLERTTIKRAKGRKSKYSASEKTVYLAENAKVDTLAHELFHEIDDAYGLIENGLLSKSVISDYNKLQNLAKGYGKSIKEMLYSRYPKAFEDNITDIKLKEAYRGISDVIHGMSNSDIFLGYGHKRAGYWDKEKALEKETFAQYGRTVFNGNEDAIKLFRELFPNSWKEISETMERMIK